MKDGESFMKEMVNANGHEDRLKIASKAMEYYTDQFLSVINGTRMSDAAFLLASLDLIRDLLLSRMDPPDRVAAEILRKNVKQTAIDLSGMNVTEAAMDEIQKAVRSADDPDTAARSIEKAYRESRGTFKPGEM